MAETIKQVEIIVGGKLITVKNDFESWCIQNGKEDLLKDWDKEKNKCSPNSKSYGSAYRAAWKCSECNYEWSTPIFSRTTIGSGCPKCAYAIRKNFVLRGNSDLETWCKENNSNLLLDEWDYEKNTLKPSEISKSAVRKVWWKCSKCGESYESKVYDRVKGHGCPVCAGRIVRSGVNDFETWCLKNGKKNLLDEWSPENDISPSEVVSGSTKRVLWVCPKCNNSWYTRVAYRKQGHDCPRCVGRYKDTKLFTDKPPKEKNDLESWCIRNGKKKLLEEWDTEENDCSPSSKSYGSAYKAAWKCSVCGYKWQAVISSRTKGIGCPRCSGRVLVVGENDLETWCKNQNKKNLLEEWDCERNDLGPGEISKSSSRKVWWKCSKCGGNYESRVYDRVEGHGCPICSGRIVKAGVNDFETWCMKNGKEVFLKEWSPENVIGPSKISVKSQRSILWECSVCNHTWRTSVYRRIQGSVCPTCNGRAVSKGVNDFETWCLQNGKEALLKEWSPENVVLPSQVTRGSSKTVEWICSTCGYRWSAMVNYRSRGSGCPYCAGKCGKVNDAENKSRAVKNDLESWCISNGKEKLLDEWDFEKNGCSPCTKTRGSGYKAAWKCSVCGREWVAAINSRTAGTGCPSCGIKRSAESRKLNRLKSE